MTRTYTLVIDSDAPDPIGEAQDIATTLDDEYNVLSVTPTPATPTLQPPPMQQTFPTQ